MDYLFNTMKPEQNGWHCASGILKGILLCKKFWILNKNQIGYVCKGLFDKEIFISASNIFMSSSSKLYPEARLIKTHVII